MTLKKQIVTPILIQNYAGSELKWKELKIKLTETNEIGFNAQIKFIEDEKYIGLDIQTLTKSIPKDYPFQFIFIADKITFDNPETSVICLEVNAKLNRWFRVIPTELWSVENNLSISNMDFEDFYNNCDDHMVFRGFD